MERFIIAMKQEPKDATWKGKASTLGTLSSNKIGAIRLTTAY